LIAVAVTGLPAAAIYGLRRGGFELLVEIIRAVLR
jgi:hypothetical protein